ncbi:MAG: RNA-binding S4 domain-containing protein [Mycoplasmataceae bacterium]|nr:RNA-binding S4 domain-containing protein [Mycoplasmataceae bacterium]MBR3347892.1 RNA-binding S4 domain-containing protein [Mycoplasmataceae bacterium]
MRVKIQGRFIKLGQLIKKLNFTDTGGQAKLFVKTHKIIINNIEGGTRNTKVWANSTVWIDDQVFYIVEDER